MVNVKNILIIGKTGSGKSTLANVITGTKKFKESQYSVSQTTEIQTEEVEIKGVKCRLIDTVGIEDTSKKEWEKLYELARISESVKDGLIQILFLMDETIFTKETKEIYKLLEKCFFDENINGYTTIVRTHFQNFRNSQKCKEEKQRILENNGEFREVIEKCVGVVFVDNPSEDVGENIDKELARKKRDKSRSILIDHLKNSFEDIDTDSKESDYRPLNLDKLNFSIKKEIVKKTLQHIVEIDPKFSRKEKIQRQLDQLEDERKKEIAEIPPKNFK